MSRKIVVGTALWIGAAAAGAQGAPVDSGAPQPQPQQQAQAAGAADLVDAEVRKVDKAAGKITLRHGEIPSLDMPPMTMVFVAGKPEMLEQVKPGDKVRFRASNEGGTFTVTELQPAE